MVAASIVCLVKHHLKGNFNTPVIIIQQKETTLNTKRQNLSQIFQPGSGGIATISTVHQSASPNQSSQHTFPQKESKSPKKSQNSISKKAHGEEQLADRSKCVNKFRIAGHGVDPPGVG